MKEAASPYHAHQNHALGCQSGAALRRRATSSALARVQVSLLGKALLGTWHDWDWRLRSTIHLAQRSDAEEAAVHVH